MIDYNSLVKSLITTIEWILIGLGGFLMAGGAAIAQASLNTSSVISVFGFVIVVFGMNCVMMSVLLSIAMGVKRLEQRS